jgi:hypothetical protein
MTPKKIKYVFIFGQSKYATLGFDHYILSFLYYTQQEHFVDRLEAASVWLPLVVLCRTVASRGNTDKELMDGTNVMF